MGHSMTAGGFAFVFLALHISGVNAQIPLRKSFVGHGFMDGFYFYTDSDPANGVVKYLDGKTAESNGLVSWTDSTFTMRADNKKVANLSPGRESVRLVSNDLFGDGVYIFDVDHIPLGCGTWPAAWTTTVKQWPWGGEIDVLEGANSLGNNSIPAVLRPQTNQTSTSTLSASPSTTAGDSSPRPSNARENVNVVSLHTAPNCHIAAANTSELTTMTGTVDNTDCSGSSPGNVGCGVKIPGPSYGIDFNNVGGGVYAMWRDLHNTNSVRTWFWARNIDPPADVKNSSSTSVDPTKWGSPVASLVVKSGCSSQFQGHAIVLNIDFCGGYGEASYSASGCPLDCASFVRNYPEAFTDAFFQFRSVRVYTNAADRVAKSSCLIVVMLASIGVWML